MAVGAPAALIAGALLPAGWLLGPIWIVALALLAGLDALLSGSRRRLQLDAPSVPDAAVGRAGHLELILRLTGCRRTYAGLEGRLAAQASLGVAAEASRVAVQDRVATASFAFVPERRGDARVDSLRLRWSGPLGLIYKQKTFALDLDVPVHVDLEWVRDRAVQLFARDPVTGIRVQPLRGEGSEFHSLRDFQTGMDRRSIDWKQSARHTALLAKEFRAERNNQIILALDSGRSGSDPVGGMPRIDRFIHVALLMAVTSLRMGDRVGLYAFDSAPRLSTGVVGGSGAFGMLQRAASKVDYSSHETNYTLGLTHLSSQLKRRSLIMVFTDFTDSTSAELMIESAARLLQRHLVVFVVLRDEELEGLAATAPEAPDDVSRAVIAESLILEREVVITRLRRMGAHIVHTTVERLGPDVVQAYMDLKRRDLL